MPKRLLKILSVCLLLSIPISVPVFQGLGQQPNRNEPSEIIFFSKEQTKWTEKREPPLPGVIGQGMKEEPWMGSFDLREDGIGPMMKMSPSSTVPGCAYSGRFTRTIAEMVGGEKALYEEGRYQYYEGKYEGAISSFKKLVQDYPEGRLAGSALYWMGEAQFRQGKDEEAYASFHKMVQEYAASEFYPNGLYSCGWIQLKREIMRRGIGSFTRALKRSRTIRLPSPRSSGRVTAFTTSDDIRTRSRKCPPFSRDIRRESGGRKRST